MQYPEDADKREGVILCVTETKEFFKEQSKSDLNFTQDELDTMYALASSDEEYIIMIANQYDINLTAEEQPGA
jgi:hypothetical protein